MLLQLYQYNDPILQNTLNYTDFMLGDFLSLNQLVTNGKDYSFAMEKGEGTLKNYLQYRWEQQQYFTPEEFNSLACQLIIQLIIIHSLDITHFDIKPSNIIIASDAQLKFSDFGRAKYKAKEVKIGTKKYMPNEIFNDTRINYKVTKFELFSLDLFAISVTLGEVRKCMLEKDQQKIKDIMQAISEYEKIDAFLLSFVENNLTNQKFNQESQEKMKDFKKYMLKEKLKSLKSPSTLFEQYVSVAFNKEIVNHLTVLEDIEKYKNPIQALLLFSKVYLLTDQFNKILACLEKVEKQISEISISSQEIEEIWLEHGILKASVLMEQFKLLDAMIIIEKLSDIFYQKKGCNTIKQFLLYSTMFLKKGQIRHRRSEFGKAIDQFTKSLAVIGQAKKLDESIIVEYNSRIENLQAEVYMNRGLSKATFNLELSRIDQEKAKVIRKKLLGPNHPLLSDSYQYIAQIQLQENDYQKAEKSITRAISLQKEISKEIHPNYAKYLSDYALILFKQGKYEEAENSYYTVKQILGRFFGHTMSEVVQIPPQLNKYKANAHNNSAMILEEFLNQPQIAEQEYKVALKIYETIYQENQIKQCTQEIAICHQNLGGLKYSQGEYKDAIQYYEKSSKYYLDQKQELLKLREEIKQNEDINDFNILTISLNLALDNLYLGCCYQKLKQYKSSISYFEKSLIFAKEAFYEDKENLIVFYQRYGISLLFIKQSNKAGAQFIKALSLQFGNLQTSEPNLLLDNIIFEKCNDIEAKIFQDELLKVLNYLSKKLKLIQIKDMKQQVEEILQSLLLLIQAYQIQNNYTMASKILSFIFVIELQEFGKINLITLEEFTKKFEVGKLQELCLFCDYFSIIQRIVAYLGGIKKDYKVKKIIMTKNVAQYQKLVVQVGKRQDVQIQDSQKDRLFSNASRMIAYLNRQKIIQ